MSEKTIYIRRVNGGWVIDTHTPLIAGDGSINISGDNNTTIAIDEDGVLNIVSHYLDIKDAPPQDLPPETPAAETAAIQYGQAIANGFDSEAFKTALMSVAKQVGSVLGTVVEEDDGCSPGTRKQEFALDEEPIMVDANHAALVINMLENTQGLPHTPSGQSVQDQLNSYLAGTLQGIYNLIANPNHEQWTVFDEVQMDAWDIGHDSVLRLYRQLAAGNVTIA